MGKSPKPEPVVTAQVCSVCGLPWDEQHRADASLGTCIEALKAALERMSNPPFQGWGGQTTQPWIQPLTPTTGTPMPPTSPNIYGSS